MSAGFILPSTVLFLVITAFLLWGGRLRGLTRALFLSISIFAFVFVLHLFSHSGVPIFSLWIFNATAEGARFGLFYGLKILVFVPAALIILLSVNPAELVLPMEKFARSLGKFGKPVSSLALSLALAFRFLPDLARQGKTAAMALRSKGIDFEGGLLRRGRFAAALLSSIFVNAFKKAESVSLAMEIKGYSSRHERAVFPSAKLSLAGLALLVISAGMIFAGWWF